MTTPPADTAVRTPRRRLVFIISRERLDLYDKLRQALELYPDNAEAKSLLLKADQTESDYQLALSAGQSALKAKNPRGAANAFKEALRLKPKDRVQPRRRIRPGNGTAASAAPAASAATKLRDHHVALARRARSRLLIRRYDRIGVPRPTTCLAPTTSTSRQVRSAASACAPVTRSRARSAHPRMASAISPCSRSTPSTSTTRRRCATASTSTI